MKKTIRYLATLMAAALAADCLFVPSTSVGGVILNAPQPMSNEIAFCGGCGGLGTIRPTMRLTESVKIRNLEPSFAYPVRSSPVGTLSTGADFGARRVPLVSVDATSRRVGSRSKMI